MFDKFTKILGMGIDSDSAYAKISTLRILCYVSNGLRFFNSNDNTQPLYSDEGYYTILNQNLNNAELLINIKN